MTKTTIESRNWNWENGDELMLAAAAETSDACEEENSQGMDDDCCSSERRQEMTAMVDKIYRSLTLNEPTCSLYNNSKNIIFFIYFKILDNFISKLST